MYIILLALPMQMAWATVADYCHFESSQIVEHFGHHADEHDLADGQDNKKSDNDSDVSSVHFDHSHASGFVGFCENCFSVAAVPSPAPQLINSDTPLKNAPLARPDKPKWPVSA